MVALGGSLGSATRYLFSCWNISSWPWGTFAVNILGSLLIGLLMGMVGKGALSPEMKLLLVTGFCGGFTTFSTFANESLDMMKGGDMFLSALYIGTSVAIGVLAVWFGMKVTGV